MQQHAERIRMEGKTIGFVPTMGYLHEGHLSLIRIARKTSDVLVVSIYVNPTQFGPDEDLDQYPRDFKRDEAAAAEEGADILFYPSNEEMYPDGYLTNVTVEEITQTLCGVSRPAHFQGVTTICTKLFHAVKPHFAVFGQKDYQQSVVIRRMVQDLNFDLKIVIGPIIREPDGLAMSSRNVYLSREERKEALLLQKALSQLKKRIEQGERQTEPLIREMTGLIQSGIHTRIDYIRIVHPDTLQDLEMIRERAVAALAVFVGKTRLIDNMILVI